MDRIASTRGAGGGHGRSRYFWCAYRPLNHCKIIRPLCGVLHKEGLQKAAAGGSAGSDGLSHWCCAGRGHGRQQQRECGRRQSSTAMPSNASPIASWSPGGNEAEVQRLLEEAAAAAMARGQLETQLDAARAAVAAARLEHETTKARRHCLPWTAKQ